MSHQSPPELELEQPELSRGSAHPDRDVLSTVAQDLLGPVGALSTSAELLLEDLGLLDAQQIRASVLAIRLRAFRLQALTENLLAAAAIEEGSLRLQPRWIRLLDVVADVAPAVGPLLAHKAQPLRLPTRGPGCHVWADPRRIGQALVNLMLHVHESAPPGTPIDLLLTTRKDTVRVTVADRRSSCLREGGEHPFEPSPGASPAAPCGGEGAELGLAVARSIVEGHGGRVGAGRGAHCWFELPRLPDVN
jgi:signal transduction histidine kinase